MGDLVPAGDGPIGEVALPGTHEVVNLEDGHAVARALDGIRQHERDVIDAKRLLTRALVAYKQHIGARTFELEDGRKVEVDTGSEFSYDAEAIEAELREAGMPEDRISQIIREEVTHRVVAAEAKKAAAASDVYREIIERNRTETEKSPSVTIRRK